VFNPQGTFLFKFGAPIVSRGIGPLNRPSDVKVHAASGLMLVTDTNNHRIKAFDHTGTFLFQLGSFGVGDGQFHHPYLVAVDNRTNRIIVSEYDNHLLHVFDFTSGFLFTFGTNGINNARTMGICRVTGLAIDSNSNILVADPYTSSIKVYSPEGNFLKKFDVEVAPCGLAVSRNGLMFIGNYHRNCLHILHQ
jgi:tripartite motif-containing protein 2/3